MNVRDLLEIEPWEWPDGAGEIFLGTLTDKQADKSDRLIAAKLGGDLVAMNEHLAKALLAIVADQNESDELRAAAAIALGPVLEQGDIELLDEEDFDDPESVPISLETFRKLRDSLHALYADERIPKLVRRRILEVAVRAQQDWQKAAIKTAWSSGDNEWILTAVFGMRHIRGFDKEILESLKSPSLEIRCEAVQAAGNWELKEAWPYVVALVQDPKTPKPLLLAAIDAVASIRPKEAGPILVELSDSRDEDIAAAADEAMAMAEANSGEDFDEEEEDEDEEGWVN